MWYYLDLLDSTVCFIGGNNQTTVTKADMENRKQG